MRTLFSKSGGGIALTRLLLGGLLFTACTASDVVFAAAATPTSKGKPQTPAPAYVEHKVTRGETLWRVAQKHKTSVGAIMDYNRMPNETVREGMTLRIPTAQAKDTSAPRQQIHVVKSRETFWSIADDYKISPKALAQANPNVNPNKIHEDMELVIPVDERPEIPASGSGAASASAPAPTSGASGAPVQSGMVAHKVDDNETYYSIAKRYGVTMEAMVAANPQVKPERLRPGMTVQVPMKTSPSRPTPQSTPPSGGSGAGTSSPSLAASASPRTYKIREGDTMGGIAQRYGVTETALLKENKLAASDPFYVDDVLKIPAASGQTTARANSGNNKTVTQPGEKTGSTPAPPSRQQQQSAPASEDKGKEKGKKGSVPSYIVSAGEDIGTICDAFGITRQQLLDYNHLPANARLKTGDEIMIPKSR
ncbi:LysM peptidoglycan-binding domain-containing protein [Roseimicrobium sp. ORNL1]|uniref:LysM peptidoglycan-binding domain-containing protein n=1 Tax=Roseimicrobium sp. ORNL1 TaxID=2711231 RepID=UPI0013E16559|nr:LysM peptidoglycan-binding domain-containing protein [Roseimicrobium sp. ORNL1]QIF00757.1 LysM peptidoglycan-binding domain-containing protein [Roseimicrobium sp. ORNL1]